MKCGRDELVPSSVINLEKISLAVHHCGEKPQNRPGSNHNTGFLAR